MNNDNHLEETAIRHIRHDQAGRRSLTSQQPIEEQGIAEESGIWDEDIAMMELWLHDHKKDLSIWW